MKVYESADIRNVVLVGHQGAGKTMLGESMLFASGAINRMGSIGEHSTVSDYHDSEHQREMSIFASLLHAEHKGKKINVLDTPGYPDFMGEVVASLKVADVAIFVLNASDPVQVGTEVGWGFAEKSNHPVLFVVNHTDKPGLDFPQVLATIQERFGRAATALQIPVGDNSRAVIDLLLMKKLTFPEGKGDPQVADIDGGFKETAEELRNTLLENVAENDEALMEKYLEGGDLSAEDLVGGLMSAVKQRLIFPILVTSATTGVGVSRLMEVIGQCAPSPLDSQPMKTEKGEDYPCNPSGEPVAFVYRTMSEQHVGEYSFFRVASGSLEVGMDLENSQSSNLERLGGLFVLNGRNRENVPKLNAGDLGATVKLKDTHTNNTLRPKGSSLAMAPIDFPEPRYKAAIRPTTPGEEDKLSGGLHKLVAEDPSLRIQYVSDLSQVLLGGQGEMHIEIAKYRLKSRFGVDVELSIPKVSYRETIQKSSRSQYRHKKQTGGAGQFADVALIVEPLQGEYNPPADIKVRGTSTVSTDWGAKIEIIDAIVSGVIDMKRFASAIQKGVLEAMRAGPIAGYPCGDVRVVVYDGKMHSVDSNEAAFKTASRQCFKQAFEQ
ncbi:MAG TPA: elongation factor G, partial [Polyangiaceae bacterium]|nr:elongation factor G [Polyangiaceae bacterium]